ncbi:MAG: zinc ABC transporter substrate-binding protein [Oscillospiraceae bacterium]|nr:zinc ABC transporter substrate-binding protein [Oscillospiraceae bacterium]
MKRILPIILILLLLAGCGAQESYAQIAATTKPIAQFAAAIADGTGLTVDTLVTEPVSCLHDYSLSVKQIQKAQHAELVLLNGGGLEDTMEGALAGTNTFNCSEGLTLLQGEEGADPHYWLDPAFARTMAENIAAALTAQYPQYADTFAANLQTLQGAFDALCGYAAQHSFGGAEIITFHDGFAYFADAMDLTILAAIEEEAGSEVSAGDLTEIIALVREHELPCVFTEENGSQDAARIIADETGCKVYRLTTCITDDDYFAAMRKNIDTVSEALSW